MRFVKVTLLILAACVALIGQTNRGGISGTVTDSNGAVVPNAKVTIKNVGTNQATTVVTSSSGAFSVTSLEPVEYDILAEATSFKKAVIQKIKVDTATVQTVNIILEVGNFAETVNIEAEDALINTESGTTSSTISEVQLRELPLNNRSVLDLAVTVANVSGDAGSEDAEVTSGQPVPGFNLSLNGGRPGGTSILADGVNNTGVGIGRAVVSFTPETVQEFTVQTSAYSAEYGNTSGGVINATTKSGTNLLNGTALFYHRNPATNARPYRIGTTPRTANNLKYSQGSLTVGGPVFLPAFGEGGPRLYDGRDRTFFFFAYEPRWRQDFITVTTLFRSQAERNGDFRNLTRTSGGWIPTAVANQFGVASTGQANIYQQFTLGANGTLVPIVLTNNTFQFCQFGATNVSLNAAGQPQCTAAQNAAPNNALNVVPTAFIDPTARRVLDFMPLGGEYFLDGGLVRNAVVNRQVTQNETRYTFKFDHQLTRANKVSFRYSKTPAIAVRNFGSDINGSTGVFSDAKQYLLTDDHIFSSSFVNNLRLSYTTGTFSEDFAPEFSINGGRNLATELGLPSLTSGGIPLFTLSSDSGTNSAFADIGSSGSTNNFNKEERYSMDDIVYWNRGNQTWKFGINMSLAKLNVIPFFAASGGRWGFRTLNTSSNRSTNTANGGDPLASLLIGVPNVVDVRPLLLDYNYYYKSGALFVQNDWKVKPNLTLNIGLRYGLQTPRGERNNQQGAFRPDLAQNVTLTDAQRTAIITGLGITTANPNYNAIVAQIPTTVSVPVFALAGRGGRSNYLVEIDRNNFEPRIGFAWSPKFWEWASKRSTAVRGGYGISHVPLTGNNRLPNPDFGGFQSVSTLANGSTVGGTQFSTQPIRLSGNAPVVGGGTFQQALTNTFGLNSDGIIPLNSLGVPGFAIAEGSGKVPYIQNWNLTVSLEIFKNTSLEVAYVGNKGSNLYAPRQNINPVDPAFTELLEASNVAAETAFADPLGRRNALGAILSIPRNSVVSTFFGFNTLDRLINPSATSVYHGTYISLRRRFSNGLSFTSNYTFGKSIDDASDSSPDVRVLTSGTTLGQSYYGAPRSGDRAVSAFDLRHNFNNTFVLDLPFGRKKAFFSQMPGVVDAVLGGWSVSGIVRFQGGQPYSPFITDTNRLNGVNRSVRLNIVEGVPLKNPLYSGACSIGGGCEPYLNPAAFTRPPKGSLGNSPRTLSLRSPMQQYFDLSIQKTWTLGFLGGEGKRRLNFRVDMLNAFNHPAFRFNNTGNTPFGYGTLPVETPVTLAEYNAWAAFNGRPNATGATDPALVAVQNLTINNRLPTGAIPLDFFSIRVPEGFATRNRLAYDITTLEGLKLYRLRGNYDANFGTLFAVNNPRYVQFGLRLFF